MFGYIRNVLLRWWFNRHRKIFTYFDGRKVRRADPMVLFARQSQHPEFDPSGDFERLKSRNPERRAAAISHLAAVARVVFDLPEYDGIQGLTQQELLILFGKFNQEMAALKKNMLGTLGSMPSTEPPPTESAEPPETNTSNSSDSTSTSEKV